MYGGWRDRNWRPLGEAAGLSLDPIDLAGASTFSYFFLLFVLLRYNYLLILLLLLLYQVDPHGFPESQGQVLKSGLYRCIETKALCKTSSSCFGMRSLQDDSTSVTSTGKRRLKQSVISSRCCEQYLSPQWSVISTGCSQWSWKLKLIYIVYIYIYIYTQILYSDLTSQKTERVSITKKDRWLLHR